MSDLPSPASQGKVRDIYDCGSTLLMVASDRISAYDFVLPDTIPHKGEVLTRLSAFWFDRFAGIVPNHMLGVADAAGGVAVGAHAFRAGGGAPLGSSGPAVELPPAFAGCSHSLAGRAMLVRKARPIPVECIVRGYLTGSGKLTYDSDGAVCGIALPPGLSEASQLSEPIFTPSTKAEQGAHDLNITFAECADIVGASLAARLRDVSLALYSAGAAFAASRGIIIADTKFEFGLVDGELTLIDECLTPDSSRFWPADGYAPGRIQPSYDKQYVRDWLRANWDSAGVPPHLPQQVVDGTASRYAQAYGLITGEPFKPVGQA